MSEVVSEMDTAIAVKEKADAEREAAVAAAQEVSEAAFVAMTGERDETVTEEEPALGEKEGSSRIYREEDLTGSSRYLSTGVYSP